MTSATAAAIRRAGSGAPPVAAGQTVERRDEARQHRDRNVAQQTHRPFRQGAVADQPEEREADEKGPEPRARR